MATPNVLDLVPHVGIGPLHLGMTTAEADEALRTLPGAGARKSHRSAHYFFDAALQFGLGESGRIQFIGLAEHPQVLCRYHGHDVFDTPAPELFALIAARESAKHVYQAAEYLFPDQVVTLYEADEQYDRKGKESRPIWGQVGVGNAEYLAAVRAIRGGTAAG
jgi:hypothetical protein